MKFTLQEWKAIEHLAKYSMQETAEIIRCCEKELDEKFPKGGLGLDEQGKKSYDELKKAIGRITEKHGIYTNIINKLENDVI